MLRHLRYHGALAYLATSEALLQLIGRRRPYGLLKLRLEGDVAEQQLSYRLPGLTPRGGGDFVSLLSLLRWARNDAGLRAVYVSCGELHVGWARLQEIRRSLKAVRDAGKVVWVYLSHAGIHEYVLASVAQRIVLAPAGTLDIAGLSSEVTFLAGALDKIGVDAELVHLGKYKSAAETFTRSSMSEPHREMVDSLVRDLYEQIVEAVADGRGLDASTARALLDRGPFVARDAERERLVDALLYEDQAEEQLRAQCGSLPTIERDDYFARHARRARRVALQQRAGSIGLVQLGGTVKMGDSIPGRGGLAASGADSLSRDLQELRERDDVRAVVIRISSPGGSGLASDLIWHEVRRTRERKPVVVSFGDVAASGGYFVGVAGSPIIAETGSITGSIGVLAGKVVLRRLYDRLGVTKEIVTQGRHAGLHSDYLPLSEEERQILRAQVEFFYTDFVSKVAAGRQLSEVAVEAAAQGRVWTGRQALALGLIDQIGGLERAFDEAKVLAGIDRNTPMAIVTYPKPKRLWKLPMNLSPMRAQLNELLPGLLPELLPELLPWLRLVASERIWAVLPIRLRFF